MHIHRLLQNSLQVLLVLTLPTLSACNQSESNQNASAAMPAVKVKVAQPLVKDVTEWDEYQGRIEATNSVEVRARVSGYLEKVNFTAGALVKKGDLLFVIDPKPFKAQLDFAVAELEKAKTRRDLAKNDLTKAINIIKDMDF